MAIFTYRRTTDGSDYRRGPAEKFYLLLNSTEQKVGSTTIPSGVGNRVITGVGFQPDAIIITAAYKTPQSGTHQARSTIGAASATSQWCNGTNLRQWVYGSSQCSWREDACVNIIDGFANELLRASLVSMDADGFTLNVSIQSLGVGFDPAGNPTTLSISWMALKGNFKVGSALTPTSGGTTEVGGVGFAPKAAWFFCAGNTAIGIRSGWDGMNGFASSEEATPSSYWAGARTSGSPNQSAYRWDNDGRCFGLHEAHKSLSPAHSRAAGTINSWLSNSLTIDWTVDGSGAYRYGYIFCDEGEAGHWQMSGTDPPDTGLPNNYSDAADITTRMEAVAMISSCTGYNFPLSSQGSAILPDVYGFPGLMHFSFGAKPWSLGTLEEAATGWACSSGGPGGGNYPVVGTIHRYTHQMAGFPASYTGDVPGTGQGMGVDVESAKGRRPQFIRYISN